MKFKSFHWPSHHGICQGGGDSHINRIGVLNKILERTPTRYQDPVLWAWPEIFSLLQGTSSKATQYLLSIFFSAQYPARYHKSSCYGPFKADHLN